MQQVGPGDAVELGAIPDEGGLLHRDLADETLHKVPDEGRVRGRTEEGPGVEFGRCPAQRRPELVIPVDRRRDPGFPADELRHLGQRHRHATRTGSYRSPISWATISAGDSTRSVPKAMAACGI